MRPHLRLIRASAPEPEPVQPVNEVNEDRDVRQVYEEEHHEKALYLLDQVLEAETDDAYRQAIEDLRTAMREWPT